MPVAIQRMQQEPVHDLGPAPSTTSRGSGTTAARGREVLLLLLELLLMLLLLLLHVAHVLLLLLHHAHHLVVLLLVVVVWRLARVSGGHHAHVAGRTAVRGIIAVGGLRGGKIGVPLLAYGYQGDSVWGTGTSV